MNRHFVLNLILIISVIACKSNENATPRTDLKEISLDSLKTLATDLPKARYLDLTFTNSNTGYAVAQGIIAKTTNAGTHWSVYSLTESNTALNKIQFVDSQIGYAIGNDGDKGVLIKTTDAGLSWKNVIYGSSESLNGMYFINKDIGFLVGTNIFSRTVDGGTSWTEIKTPDYAILNDVNFKNISEGIVTGNNGVYYKTEDGGSSWKPHMAIKSNLGDIYFTENEELVTLSPDSLLSLNIPFKKIAKPSNANKLLFINSQQAIGIGSHYEQGYWPYGDILISNNNLKTFDQKSYTPSKSISFDAITKISNDKIMIIGTGFNGPIIITLNLK